MAQRIPASERTSQRIRDLLKNGLEGDGDQLKSNFVQLAVRKVLEEMLEGEVTDVLKRDYYRHGAEDGGYRNGYRQGRLKTAEGEVQYAAPQVSDRPEPFRSQLREILGGRTDELERLAVEMYARG
jgi:transposase-like protein